MKKNQKDIQIINLSKRLTLSQQLDEQPELIQDLIIIFSLVGVRCFDLSPKKEIVEAANVAIKEAQSLSKTLGLEFSEPILNVSVGRINPFLGDYLLAEKTKSLDTFDLDLLETQLISLYQLGVKTFELHSSSIEEDLLEDIWRLLTKLVKDNYLLLNVNRNFFSNSQMVNLIKRLFYITPEKKMILVLDGATSADIGHSYSDTIQTLATADIAIKDLKIRERRAFKKLPIFICGDINRKTIALAKICSIDHQGISFGDHGSNNFYLPVLNELNKSIESKLHRKKTISKCIDMGRELYNQYNYTF